MPRNLDETTLFPAKTGKSSEGDARRGEAQTHPGIDETAEDRNAEATTEPARIRPGEERLQGASSPPTGKGRSRRRPLVIALIVVVILAGVAAGVHRWLNTRQYESTDDAFIEARTVSISADITGKIVGVPVTDNQLVKAGQTLVRIDPRDYKAAVAQAKAQVEQAKSSVANIEAQMAAQQSKIAQAKTLVTQTRAALTYAQQQNVRAQNLLKTGAGTKQNAEQTGSQLIQSRAAYAAANANEKVAEKQLPVLRTQRDSAVASVGAAQAKLEQAQVNLARTVVDAPTDGHIANLSAAVGAYAQPGQALMSLVPLKVWVVANFKETQITDMRPGQPVDVTIDAYPGRVFHGHLQSIQAGSGTAFSLLPPENATGNFVKVVQRVPVKIVFNKPPGVYLGPGMSVEPSVKVR